MFINLSCQTNFRSLQSFSISHPIADYRPLSASERAPPFINLNKDFEATFRSGIRYIVSPSSCARRDFVSKAKRKAAALLSSQHTMNHHHCLHYLFRRFFTFLLLFSQLFAITNEAKQVAQEKIASKEKFQITRRKKLFSFAKNDNFLPLGGVSEN